MPWLLLGLLALIAFISLWRWAAYADVAKIKRWLWILGAGMAVAVAVLLAISGRFTAALPFLIPIFFVWRRLPRLNRNDDRAKPSSSGLSLQEARDMLGVGPDATAAEITAAHRRLIAKLHPDQGGSNYLAAKLNEAKALLLKNLG